VQQPNHIPTEELQQLPSTYRDFRSRPSTWPDSPLPPPPSTMHTCDGVHVVLQDLPVSLLSSVPASFLSADYRRDSRRSLLLLLLLTAAAEECVHVKRIPDAATADAAVRKAMQIYSRPTHAPPSPPNPRQRESRAPAREERDKMTSERAQRWRAPQETTLRWGRGMRGEAGLPGSQSGSGTRAARNGGTEATGVVRSKQISSKNHPSTSLFEFTSHEILGNRK
jgi:hypothetical protein